MILVCVKWFLQPFAVLFDLFRPISRPQWTSDVINSCHSVQLSILKALHRAWLPTFRTQSYLRIPFRGVTSLDGARGKKQVWCPHVRTWGFLEANVLYWRKYLWQCWEFSAPAAVIRSPPVIWDPGNCSPFVTPLIPLTLCLSHNDLFQA